MYVTLLENRGCLYCRDGGFLDALPAMSNIEELIATPQA